MTSNELYDLRDKLAKDLADDSKVLPYMQHYMKRFSKPLVRPILLAIVILVADHDHFPRPQRPIQRYYKTLLWFINANWFTHFLKAMETFDYDGVNFTLFGKTEQLLPGNFYPNLCRNTRRGRVEQLESAKELIVDRLFE
jgi:hypothetical protein